MPQSAASPENAQRMEWLIDNNRFDLPNEMRPDCHHDDHSYRSMYGRLDWDQPAQTITTGYGSMGQGRYMHPSRPRTLTPHEAARLQTFPDFFEFGDDQPRKTWAHVIGNAVPPLLGVHIGQPLLTAMAQPARSLGSNGTGARRRAGIPPASSEVIRKRMSTTRRRDTKPELALRAELDRFDLNYQIDHPVDGTRRRADVVFLHSKVAIYVDGCYWHGCPAHGTTPKPTMSGGRQSSPPTEHGTPTPTRSSLRSGWAVLRFWEHDDPLRPEPRSQNVLAPVARTLNGNGCSCAASRRPTAVSPSRSSWRSVTTSDNATDVGNDVPRGSGRKPQRGRTLGRRPPGRAGPGEPRRHRARPPPGAGGPPGPQWVDLCWVDEVALALIDLAVSQAPEHRPRVPGSRRAARRPARRPAPAAPVRPGRAARRPWAWSPRTPRWPPGPGRRSGSRRPGRPGTPDRRLPVPPGRSRGESPPAGPALPGADRRAALRRLARGLSWSSTTSPVR